LPRLGGQLSCGFRQRVERRRAALSEVAPVGSHPALDIESLRTGAE
jgi:hypothetical protein